MSLMDDVFDMRDHVKDTDMEKAFDRIETRLWLYEEAHDILMNVKSNIQQLKWAVEKVEAAASTNVPDSAGE